MRLRYTRNGWYRVWAKFLTGATDIRTGITYPDKYGRFEREIWVGPFQTATEAGLAQLL